MYEVVGRVWGCGEYRDVGGVVVRDCTAEGVRMYSQEVWGFSQTARSVTSTQLLKSSEAQHPQQ